MDSKLIDNCRVNMFVKTFHNAVYNRSMEDFYNLFDRFGELSKEERDSAILSIVFYKYINEVN